MCHENPSSELDEGGAELKRTADGNLGGLTRVLHLEEGAKDVIFTEFMPIDRMGKSRDAVGGREFICSCIACVERQREG